MRSWQVMQLFYVEELLVQMTDEKIKPFKL